MVMHWEFRTTEGERHWGPGGVKATAANHPSQGESGKTGKQRKRFPNERPEQVRPFANNSS